MFKNIIAIFHAVSLIIICLFTAVCIPTFSMGFYNYEFAKNNVYNTINIEQDELLRVTKHLTDYMRDKNDDLRIDAVVAGEIREFFNEKEILHMVDVKDLFSAGFMLRNVSFVVLLLTIIIMFKIVKNPWKLFYLFDKIVIGIIFAFTVILSVVIAYDFDSAFNKFHELFFSNDLWILDPSKDLLLNMVPLPFFMDIALVIFVLFILLILISVSLTKIFCRLFNKNGEN